MSALGRRLPRLTKAGGRRVARMTLVTTVTEWCNAFDDESLITRARTVRYWLPL